MSHKLKYLLEHWPIKTVGTASWMESLGIRRGHRQIYVRNGWIKRIANGAYIRPHEEPNWVGGLYAVQNQLRLPVHVGGISALGFLGLKHFLSLGSERVTIFTSNHQRLPKWFVQTPWNQELIVTQANFLPAELSLQPFEPWGVPFLISNRERAALELLHQTPHLVTYSEASLIWQNLHTLRPSVVQELLESCKNLTLKRAFLYLSQKKELPWLEDLNIERISLGTSTLSMEKGGSYNKQYNLVVPKDWKDE